ncbi:MAG: hypothetical protein AB7F75_09235 [Planctomycetota bacterium]
MSQQKTILLPILFGLTLRNYLRTGFLDEIEAAGHRLVVLLPDPEIDGLREEFAPRGVTFETYPPAEPSDWEKRLKDLRDVRFKRKHPLLVLEYKEQEMKELSWNRWFLNHKVLGPLLPLLPQPVLDRMYERAHATRTVDALWDRVRPDLLVSTNSFFWEELPLMAKARATRTPVFGMIHSWDNLTSKTCLPYHCDRIGVWNETMFRELAHFYPGWETSAVITGVPQFDYYASISKTGKPRDVFLKELDLDPSLPLISYTTVPDKISPACFHDVRLLLEAIKDGQLPRSNVLVRFHQTGNMEPFKALGHFPNLVVEKPGRMNAKMKDFYNPTQADMIHFADTLRHSQCTINTRSTVSVDASFFDVPIVNPGADFSPGGPKDRHVRDLYLWEHYLPIVASGGVEVAGTPTTYIQAVRRSLEHLEYRREGRVRLKAMFEGPEPGRSAHRLAREVLSLLG